MFDHWLSLFIYISKKIIDILYQIDDFKETKHEYTKWE